MSAAPIKGVPEGLEFVELKPGSAADDEYELIGTTIRKGPRVGAASAVIVKASEGYAITPRRMFDIRKFKYVDVPNEHMVVKLTAPVAIKATVSFSVSNEFDQQTVLDALDHLKEITGFVDLVRE